MGPLHRSDDAFFDAIEDNALDDAADADAMLTMPAEARLNLTPDPRIPGRGGYVRIG